MDTFDRNTLLRLIDQEGAPCISMFLPTHPAGKDGEQDAIRIKNLSADVERQLAGHWMSAADARDCVTRAASLPNDRAFWQQRGQGLAVFISPSVFETYRLPIEFHEQAIVTNRFRIRPMLPLLERGHSFYLLTISENKVAFSSVDEHSIETIQVPGLPENIQQSLNYVGADRGSQVHSGSSDLPGKQAAVFHGHGGLPDTAKADLLAFCADIDKAITAWLGESTKPILLACVETVASMYRKKSLYRYLLPAILPGNHDHESEHDLQRNAWRVAEPLLTSESNTVIERYADRLGTALSTDDPSVVVTAARQGRVESLLYNAKAELFGECSLPADTVVVTGKADDEDLVDLAAVETLRRGGTIHSMADRDVPTNAPMAAILRY